MTDYTETKVIEGGVEYTVRDYLDGKRLWRLNGKLSRVGGPAVKFAHGTYEYRLNGKRHRSDGPAVVYANGDREWWLFGKEVTEAEHAKMVGAPTPGPLLNPSMDEMSLRDWFAGQAMKSLRYHNLDFMPDVYARDAYLYADAMIAERNKK